MQKNINPRGRSFLRSLAGGMEAFTLLRKPLLGSDSRATQSEVGDVRGKGRVQSCFHGTKREEWGEAESTGGN